VSVSHSMTCCWLTAIPVTICSRLLPVRQAAFPVAPAEAYTAEFDRVCLNFNPRKSGGTGAAAGAFVPGSSAATQPDLGWNGVGELSLQSVIGCPGELRRLPPIWRPHLPSDAIVLTL
jgi:hypothetical protein